jgi:hypothetical protein
MRVIEVIVSPEGQAVIQTKGYAGSDCLHASEFLQDSLGATTADRRTAEFYQGISTEQHVHQ